MANKRKSRYKTTINIVVNNKENAKIEKLKYKYKVNSKTNAIKKAIMEVEVDG